MHPDRTIPQFKQSCDRNLSARYVFQLITTHETNLSRVANLLIKYSGLTLKWYVRTVRACVCVRACVRACRRERVE